MLNAQVKVLGKIEPNGPTDTYPTHVDSLGKGGLMAVGSWQERNAIPLVRRKAGMLVRVKSAMVDSTYTLGVSLTNTNWTPFITGPNITTSGALQKLGNDISIKNSPLFEGQVAIRSAGSLDVYTGSYNGGVSHNNEADGSLKTITMRAGGNATGNTADFYTSSGLNAYTFDKPIKINGVNVATISDISGPVDITGKEDKSNKVTSLVVTDNSTYPTTQAVQTALDTKLTGTRATNLLNPDNNKFPTAQTMVNVLAGYEQNTNKATSLANPSNTTYPTTQAVANGLAAKAHATDLIGKANLTGGNTFSGPQTFTYISQFTDELHAGAGIYTDGSDIDMGQASLRDLGEANFVQYIGNSSYRGSLRGTNTFSANRIFTLPDASGTIALISDITGKANLIGNNTFRGEQYFQGGAVFEGNIYAENGFSTLASINAGAGMTAENGQIFSGGLMLKEFMPSTGYANFLVPSGLSVGYNLYVPIKPTGDYTIAVSDVHGTFRVTPSDTTGNSNSKLTLVDIEDGTSYNYSIRPPIGDYENREYKLPSTSGSLATMEQILEMTTVQVTSGFLTDMGNPYQIPASKSRLKKFFYEWFDNTSVELRLPQYPFLGDVVEIIKVNNGSNGMTASQFLFNPSYVVVKAYGGLGAQLNIRQTDHMVFRWNGSAWEDLSIDGQ